MAALPAQAEDCSTAGTQTELNQCSARNYQDADQILNRVFEQAIENALKMDREVDRGGYSYENALRRAQNAWIAYRDADCAQPPRELAGSISPSEQADCLTQRTLERTKDLNERMGGE